MKIFLLLPLALLVNHPYGNSKIEKAKAEFEISSTISKNEISANELVGQWKRTAGGSDDNKNRILDESEKMKLEPGAQDNLHFNADGKCKVFGMGIEAEGTWLVKNYNGKRTLFVYTDDLKDRPQDERDKSAMRFEIISLEANKLVVIPPIYLFMISVYTRS